MLKIWLNLYLRIVRNNIQSYLNKNIRFNSRNNSRIHLNCVVVAVRKTKKKRPSYINERDCSCELCRTKTKNCFLLVTFFPHIFFPFVCEKVYVNVIVTIRLLMCARFSLIIAQNWLYICSGILPVVSYGCGKNNIENEKKTTQHSTQNPSKIANEKCHIEHLSRHVCVLALTIALECMRSPSYCWS